MREEIGERSRHARDLGGRFVDELQTEIRYSSGAPIFKAQAGFLRFSAEDGVPAADIRHDRMRASAGVAHGDAVLFARAAAILVARARRKEAAEHAMFGMKNRKMLVCNRLNAVPADISRESGDLLSVEIVGGRDWKRQTAIRR